MALRITKVTLASFRNWENLELEPDPALTLVVGQNAVGKTNLIEAIQLTTSAVSFRKPQWKDVVRWGDPAARVALTAEGDGRKRDVTMNVDATGKRSYEVNGAAKRTIADVAGPLPSVIFTPDDLGLIKDSAERRRSELDELGSQLSKTYREIKAEYERSVRQRNALLREGAEGSDVFAAWTQRLVETGSRLALHRIRLFKRLGPHIESRYAQIAESEDLSSEYLSGWWEPDTEADAAQVEEAMRRALERRRSDELARRMTLVGPHRDDVVFRVAGAEARSSASQGQQRTIALAWKLSEVAVVTEVSGTNPILLLDDVMSELDTSRRQALSKSVQEAAQTIVTTTNLGYFSEDVVSSAKVVSLGE